MAVKVQYVLLMKDQSYYVRTGDDGHLETTLLIYEAYHFDTRWEALVQAAQSKLFAYATIHPHRQEIPEAPPPQEPSAAGCAHDPAGIGGPCPFCAALVKEAANG